MQTIVLFMWIVLWSAKSEYIELEPMSCRIADGYYCKDSHPRSISENNWQNIVVLLPLNKSKIAEHRPQKVRLPVGSTLEWLPTPSFSSSMDFIIKTVDQSVGDACYIAHGRLVSCPHSANNGLDSASTIEVNNDERIKTFCETNRTIQFRFSPLPFADDCGPGAIRYWLPPRRYGIHHESNHSVIQTCPICARGGECDDGPAGHGCCSYKGYPKCQCDDGYTNTATGCNQPCDLPHQVCFDEPLTSFALDDLQKGTGKKTTVNEFGDRVPWHPKCQQGWHGLNCTDTCLDEQGREDPLCGGHGVCIAQLRSAPSQLHQHLRHDQWDFVCSI